MYSTFEGMILARTARAVLFQSNYWDAPLWFPVSQANIVPDGDMSVVIHVKEWLTTKRGLLEFTAYSENEIKGFAGTQ